MCIDYIINYLVAFAMKYKRKWLKKDPYPVVYTHKKAELNQLMNNTQSVCDTGEYQQ